MKALVYRKSTGLTLETNYEKPKRSPHQALVRIIRAGICKTDLEITKGYMGFEGILGHEFVGKIEEIDPNEKGLVVGQRVVGEINLYCNMCRICEEGGIIKRNHCLDRTVLGILGKDGTFGEYMTLPVGNLFPVPDNISNDEAVFVEPLAAAFRVLEQGLVKSSDKVAVVGDGKLGLLIAEAIYSEYQENVTILGHHMDKMELLPPGIKKVIADDVSAKKYENYFDVVVEATGSPVGFMMSSGLVQPLGTIVLKTTCAAGANDFNTAPFVIKEIKIIGSRCGNFEMALLALEEKKISVKKFLHGVYPVDESLKAFEHAASRGTLKIQVEFS